VTECVFLVHGEPGLLRHSLEAWVHSERRVDRSFLLSLTLQAVRRRLYHTYDTLCEEEVRFSLKEPEDLFVGPFNIRKGTPVRLAACCCLLLGAARFLTLLAAA